jgi:hypothetical protein
MRAVLVVVSSLAILALVVTIGPDRAQAESAEARCHRSLDAFLNALTEIDGQLGVGLNVRQYAALLRRANVAHSRVPWKRIDGSCLFDVALPLARARYAYSRALTSWQECVAALDCDRPVGEGFRQRMWRIASVNIDRAVNRLG